MTGPSRLLCHVSGTVCLSDNVVSIETYHPSAVYLKRSFLSTIRPNSRHFVLLYISYCSECHSLVDCKYVVFILCIFTALHVMQTRYSEENSVCPSVRLSVTRVIPDKTEERSVQIFIPYERIFILVF